ncbi:MAG: hypothetical protein LBF75_03715, partial [Treponema sp.]|nr:hypothetical protein [Treponema sp.]
PTLKHQTNKKNKHKTNTPRPPGRGGAPPSIQKVSVYFTTALLPFSSTNQNPYPKKPTSFFVKMTDDKVNMHHVL